MLDLQTRPDTEQLARDLIRLKQENVVLKATVVENTRSVLNFTNRQLLMIRKVQESPERDPMSQQHEPKVEEGVSNNQMEEVQRLPTPVSSDHRPMEDVTNSTHPFYNTFGRNWLAREEAQLYGHNYIPDNGDSNVEADPMDQEAGPSGVNHGNTSDSSRGEKSKNTPGYWDGQYERLTPVQGVALPTRRGAQRHRGRWDEASLDRSPLPSPPPPARHWVRRGAQRHQGHGDEAFVDRSPSPPPARHQARSPPHSSEIHPGYHVSEFGLGDPYNRIHVNMGSNSRKGAIFSDSEDWDYRRGND